MSEHDIFPIPLYFIQPEVEECVFGSRRKLKVSVLSVNLKNAGFAIFLAATPSVLLRKSGPGLKLTQS